MKTLTTGIQLLLTTPSVKCIHYNQQLWQL